MSRNPPGVSYLDALFASLRAFGQELEASRRWAARAEHTESLAWRRSFLAEARATYQRLPGLLAEVVEQLAALGPAESLPAPLDRLNDNLVGMRAALAAHGESLVALEAKEAFATPVGRA